MNNIGKFFIFKNSMFFGTSITNIYDNDNSPTNLKNSLNDSNESFNLVINNENIISIFHGKSLSPNEGFY